MYKLKTRPSSLIKKERDLIEGESIEAKLRRLTQTGEPIKDTVPIIYTERKDGVQPAYNIRTDRMEIARTAMDKVHKTDLAKREERLKKSLGEQAKEGMKKEGGEQAKEGGGEPASAPGTDPK